MDTPPTLRPATAADWPAVLALLQAHQLPPDGAQQHLPQFWLALQGPQLAACAGLEVHGDVALLRSVAVAPGLQHQGLGRALVAQLVSQARRQGLRALVLLTTTAADYFARLGFQRLPQAQAPAALQASAEFQGACPASAVCMALPLAWCIRPATLADAAQLLAIYAPYVADTAVSFETEVPALDEFERRISKALSRWQWLVADEGGRCIGYAYGSLHRERPAYQWSTEVSAYVHPSHHRQGVAGALYRQLFVDLAALGYAQALAGITQPNAASVALHRSLGFLPIGVFRSVGRKFDRWHDVAWSQRALRTE